MKFIKCAVLFVLIQISFSALAAGEKLYQLIDLEIAPTDQVSNWVTGINNDGKICGTFACLDAFIKDDLQYCIFTWDPYYKLNYTDVVSITPPMINNRGEVYGIRKIFQFSGTFEPEHYQQSLYKWTHTDNFFDFLSFYHLGCPKTHPSSLSEENQLFTYGVNDYGHVLVTDQAPVLDRLATKNEGAVFSDSTIWLYDESLGYNLQNHRFYKINHPQLTFVTTINNNSHVLGGYYTSTNHIKPSIFDYVAKTLRSLDFPADAIGYDLNDQDEIVGVYFNPQTNSYEGFYLTLSGELISIPGFIPIAMNNNGQVIGKFMDGDKKDQPALWMEGKLFDLADVVNRVDNKRTSWIIKTVVDINDKGDIIGNGRRGDANRSNISDEGFLLKRQAS